jgi:hypothetical protein
MPTTVECPHCHTKLRLLRPAPPGASIHCSVCDTNFFLHPVETVPVIEAVPVADPPQRAAVGGPRPAAAPAPRPALRVVADEAAPGPADADAPPPPLALSSPPPPPIPKAFAAPGMPKPVAVKASLNSKFRSRLTEPLLGASLTALIVVAIASGAFIVHRLVSISRASKAGSAPAPPAAVEAGPGAADPVAPARHQPSDPPGFKDWLVGVWESRADDGSHSSFDFRADGTALAAPAGDAGEPGPAVSGRWAVIQWSGNEYVLDFGPDFDLPMNHRFTIRVGGPDADAFTLVDTLHGGVGRTDELRFVRRRAPAAPPP